MMRYLDAYVFANLWTTILMIIAIAIRETVYFMKTEDAGHFKRFNRYIGNVGKMTWKDWLLVVCRVFFTGWIRAGWFAYKYYEFLNYEEAQTEKEETRG